MTHKFDAREGVSRRALSTSVFAAVLAVGAATAPSGSARAQVYFQPYAQSYHPQAPARPRGESFVSRREIAALLYDEGYRLAGPIDYRDDAIIAVGVDDQGRRMRFFLDPDDGEVVGARRLEPLQASRSGVRDEESPVRAAPRRPPARNCLATTGCGAAKTALVGSRRANRRGASSDRARRSGDVAASGTPSRARRLFDSAVRAATDAASRARPGSWSRGSAIAASAARRGAGLGPSGKSAGAFGFSGRTGFAATGEPPADSASVGASRHCRATERGASRAGCRLDRNAGACRARSRRRQTRGRLGEREKRGVPRGASQTTIFVSRYAALASTTLASTVFTAAGAGAPMSMRRGFWASGISRTRSTCSRPFSSAAPVTTT
jgi:hypothetical protein